MSRVPPLSLAGQRPSTFQLWSPGSCWFWHTAGALSLVLENSGVCVQLNISQTYATGAPVNVPRALCPVSSSANSSSSASRAQSRGPRSAPGLLRTWLGEGVREAGRAATGLTWLLYAPQGWRPWVASK